MKIAVMSDIHGNYIALQRCLAHALEQNVDAYIFLGDYLGEFPYPQRTLEILYELKQNASCIFIRGIKKITGSIAEKIKTVTGKVETAVSWQ